MTTPPTNLDPGPLSEGRLAKVKGQNPDIFYGSSLAIQGVFVEVMRARFRGINTNTDIPYYWDADPTPLPTENNEAGNPRKLYIESEYLEFPDAKNYRPAILVDAAECVPIKDVVTNRAGVYRPQGIEGFYSRCQTSMEVLVIDDTRGACSVLGDIAWFHLLACRMLIRQEFRIHEMTEPVKGRVIPFRRDQDIWECPITFNVQVEMRWLTKEIAPLLRSVRANLTAKGNGDVSIGAIQVALYNENTPRIKVKG
jgi:hypothetical protein